MEPLHDLTVGPATNVDRDFVARLSGVVFSRFGPYDRFLVEMMEAREVRTLVASAGQDRVGFAMFDPTFPEVDLLAIATEPAWQARGVGRRLLEHVEREACAIRRGRRTWLTLSVAEDNLTARRFFESAGFAPVRGRGGSYPAGQPSLGMRKLLCR